MPVVRIYVPLGGAMLRGLAGTGFLAAGADAPVAVFAVTAALAEQAPTLDEEELEYAAFADAVAAAASRREDPADPRLVLAADADPEAVRPGAGAPSAVELVDTLPISRIASFHVDEAEPSAAREEADTLLWYDVTELGEVVRFFPERAAPSGARAPA